jgi:hypothetical protein
MAGSGKSTQLNSALVLIDQSVACDSFFANSEASLTLLTSALEHLTDRVSEKDFEGLSSDFLKTILASGLIALSYALNSKKNALPIN